MSEPMFLLDASSLLSKWGFADGDALSDWWWDNFDCDPPFSDHDAIYSLAEKYLVPQMELAGWTVELVRIQTIHNPARAERLNGVEVDWYAGTTEIPVEARVTKEQILAVVATLAPVTEEGNKE